MPVMKNAKYEMFAQAMSLSHKLRIYQIAMRNIDKVNQQARSCRVVLKEQKTSWGGVFVKCTDLLNNSNGDFKNG